MSNIYTPDAVGNPSEMYAKMHNTHVSLTEKSSKIIYIYSAGLLIAVFEIICRLRVFEIAFKF